MRKVILSTSVFVSMILAQPSAAGVLNLTLEQTTDISGLGFGGVGGMAYDDVDGRLWLSDAGSFNRVVEINPLTGAVFSSFSASVVPGLTLGPDAIALQPSTGDLYLFSTFLEDDAGVVTQAGTLVSDFGANSNDAGGATFSNTGQLFVFDEDDGALVSLDPANGNVISTTLLTNFTGRIAAADFDPVSGNLFAYDPGSRDLLEVDVNTATVLSTTSIASFLSSPSFPTGIAFDTTGDRLFVVSGTNTAAGELVVLRTNNVVGAVPEPGSFSVFLGILGAAGGMPIRRRRTNTDN